MNTTNYQVWNRIKERLIYLPGAVVLVYGFWLSFNAS